MRSVALRRVAALLWKERRDLRGSWAPWLPGLLMFPMLLLPFFFTLLLPVLANEPLERSDFAGQLEAVTGLWPELARLTGRAAVQAFVFQQFLVLVVLVPVSGAMSIAAHSIIGEKQGRSLEPLLATPVTSTELLLGKVLAALLPALLLEAVAVVLYLGGVALLSDPGVLRALLSGRTVLVVAVIGPLASLVGLQLVVMTSTRARDPRSAQQVGVLIVLPIVAVLVAQGAGAFWLTVPALTAAGIALVLLWIVLLRLSAAFFDREQVLTRWR